jgi:hypothetical protein
MNRYAPPPKGPFEHVEAVSHVRSTHGIPARDVADMLIAATRSPSGMASLPIPGSRRRVWATHMTTQDGKFMIEVE